MPVIRIADYGLEELFEKKLLLLVPFYVFRISDREFEEMEKGSGMERLKGMLDGISGKLDEMVRGGELEAWKRRNILNYVRQVLNSLTTKYENVGKEVNELMGGYLIRTDVDEAMDRGIDLGKDLGREEGSEKKQAEMSGLIGFLLNNGRVKELQEAAGDRSLMDRLLEEFRSSVPANA